MFGFFLNGQYCFGIFWIYPKRKCWKTQTTPRGDSTEVAIHNSNLTLTFLNLFGSLQSTVFYAFITQLMNWSSSSSAYRIRKCCCRWGKYGSVSESLIAVEWKACFLMLHELLYWGRTDAVIWFFPPVHTSN